MEYAEKEMMTNLEATEFITNANQSYSELSISSYEPYVDQPYPAYRYVLATETNAQLDIFSADAVEIPPDAIFSEAVVDETAVSNTHLRA